MTLSLSPAAVDDLARFAAFEQEPDTAEFIIPSTSEQHAACFEQPNVVYLAIRQAGDLVGFILLQHDGPSVEFRRIVITPTARGIGQQAITEMEHYCRTQLSATRVWLDVFAHNHRGRHIYEKLGYRQTNTARFEGQPLIIMDKRLDHPEHPSQ